MQYDKADKRILEDLINKGSLKQLLGMLALIALKAGTVRGINQTCGWTEDSETINRIIDDIYN